MADIPIWPGSSSFATGISSFGFYDNDTDFQSDAPLVSSWCAQRLGYPLIDIELQDKNLFTAFEEAISEYGAQVYQFQVINNLFRIKGNTTGSVLNQIYLDDWYGQSNSGGGGGGNTGGSGTSYNLTDSRLYSASLHVKRGTQKYNLLSSSPELATATITFTGIPSVSESIQLQDVGGNIVSYEAHTSSSTYFVSQSLNQFEPGSDAITSANNLFQIISSGSQDINATISASVISLTQKFEGIGGNTSIINTLSNVTTTNFGGGNSGLNFEVSGSAIQSGVKKIKVKKIYHYQPAAINRYFDPYAGTGTGIQSLMQTFGMGNYSPGVNFMLMPLYFDALKLQAIEMNDSIRKSAYHFEINAGQFLKLFPIPTNNYKLWFEYTMADSAQDPGLEDGPQGEEIEKSKNLVTDISNAPYERPTYAYINAIGRQWIRKYALALAKEMLGSVRGKYQSLPIPGSETTLDYTRLLSEAAAEKESLIVQLREDIEATTTLKNKERASAEAGETQTLYGIDNPYQIYIH